MWAPIFEHAVVPPAACDQAEAPELPEVWSRIVAQAADAELLPEPFPSTMENLQREEPWQVLISKLPQLRESS